jgi:hypothetical protein
VAEASWCLVLLRGRKSICSCYLMTIRMWGRATAQEEGAEAGAIREGGIKKIGTNGGRWPTRTRLSTDGMVAR